MRFDVRDHGRVDMPCEGVIIAGFTGRNHAANAAHVREIAATGVTEIPETFPVFYALPPTLLTQADSLTITSEGNSGEAEIVLLVSENGTFVTVGSDHTDRDAQLMDIRLSKLAAPKVLAREAWRLEDVCDHWDQLELRSWIVERVNQIPYQAGSAESMLPPDELLGMIPFSDRPRCFALFTGTLHAIGGIRPAEHFSANLHDPVRGETLAVAYSVQTRVMLAGADG